MCKATAKDYTGPQVRDKETFVKKSLWLHGDKYDYGRVVYVRSRDKIEITCPKHGTFHQTPNDHLNGKGCVGCAIDARGASHSYDTQAFVKQACKVHGSRYDYSEVEYTNSRMKVVIICPDHGRFSQEPSNHVQGASCLSCAVATRAEARRNKSDVNFVVDSQAVHGNRYDYSKTVYQSARVKVSIICPAHGEFKQTPNSHLSGNGCPVRATS